MNRFGIYLLSSILLVGVAACDQGESSAKKDAVDQRAPGDLQTADVDGPAEADCGATAPLADGACLAEDLASMPDLATADSNPPDVPANDIQDTALADLTAPDLTVEDVVAEFPLEVGDKVPDFSLKAHDGTTFTLSAYAGKNVLISSFPAAKTAVCEWQTCYVNDHYAEFIAVNTVPVGLSTDNLGKLALWAEEQTYQQLLLSDTNPIGGVSKMLGIFTESLMVTTRALLVIDGTGTLVYKKIFAMGAKPDFDALMLFLKGLPQ